MKLVTTMRWVVLLFAISPWLVGCQQPDGSGPAESSSESGGAAEDDGHDHAEDGSHTHADGEEHKAAGDADETSEAGDDQAVLDAINGLGEEDRAIALAQKTCPVSGARLGSMDTPVKVDLDGRSVFICCAGCQSPLTEDPAKYLAKLDAVN